MYCGNNALHRSLQANGGSKIFGTHEQCFKKGYGIGFNAAVSDAAKFITEWSGPYKPHIVQRLIYGDDKFSLESGYQRATLNQSLARGFGLGRVARAKKMSRKAVAKASPRALTPKQQKPTLPLKGPTRKPSQRPSSPRPSRQDTAGASRG